jgi:Cu-Zn family superoxide dismutase
VSSSAIRAEGEAHAAENSRPKPAIRLLATDRCRGGRRAPTQFSRDDSLSNPTISDPLMTKVNCLGLRSFRCGVSHHHRCNRHAFIWRSGLKSPNGSTGTIEGFMSLSPPRGMGVRIMKSAWITVALTMGLAGCGSPGSQDKGEAAATADNAAGSGTGGADAQSQRAVAALQTAKSAAAGSATASAAEGGIRLALNVEGLPPGPHGAHVHMTNLTVGADGRGSLEYVLQGGSFEGLLDSDGSALVIHAAADDQKTDPSGNSGDRIACGVFRAQ